MRDYRELDVWNESRALNKMIYEVTKQFPEEEKFGLTSQMRRCSVSISSNIAEGCGRNSDPDLLRFLFIARGSLFEVETQLYLALDLDYLDTSRFDDLQVQITACKKLLNGFISYFKNKQPNH